MWFLFSVWYPSLLKKKTQKKTKKHTRPYSQIFQTEFQQRCKAIQQRKNAAFSRNGAGTIGHP